MDGDAQRSRRETCRHCSAHRPLPTALCYLPQAGKKKLVISHHKQLWVLLKAAPCSVHGQLFAGPGERPLGRSSMDSLPPSLPPSPLLFSLRMKQKGIRRMFFLPTQEISGASSVALHTARCAVPCWQQLGSSWVLRWVSACRPLPQAGLQSQGKMALGSNLAMPPALHQDKAFMCSQEFVGCHHTCRFLSGWPRRAAGPILVLQAHGEWHWGKAGDSS